MVKKNLNLEKPAVASLSFWEVLLTGVLTSAGLGLVIWGMDLLLFLSNTWNVLLGVGALLIGLWNWWAWRPRRKHGQWYRWLGTLSGAIYFSILCLLLAIACWGALLDNPWNWIVNGVLIMLFIVAWVLPALSYPWSRRIAHAQDTLGLRMLAFGGVGSLMVLAGILGAIFGTSASRNGENGSALLVTAFLSPLLAVFLAQYNAERLWRYRPWRKEEDEE